MLAPDEHAAEADRSLLNARAMWEDSETHGAWTEALIGIGHALRASQPEPEQFDGPSRMELVRELREAVGLPTSASPMPPRQAWIEALDRARLATRPGPASELVRRAVRAETAGLKADNDRWRAAFRAADEENDRLRARLAELVDAVGGGNTPAIRDQIKRAIAVLTGGPVSSTGEDQSGVTWAIRVHPADETGEDQGDENCSRCGHLKTEHGFPYSIECDAEGCICGAFEPVPDEGSETGEDQTKVCDAGICTRPHGHDGPCRQGPPRPVPSGEGGDQP